MQQEIRVLVKPRIAPTIVPTSADVLRRWAGRGAEFPEVGAAALPDLLGDAALVLGKLEIVGL